MKRIGLFLVLFGVLCGWNQAHAQQTVKFTVQQTVNPDRSVTPTLTWCTERTATTGLTCGTSGPASSCTASGDWTGTKPAAGTAPLPSVLTSKTFNLQCTWPGSDSITLSWGPPTQNDDGSALTDLKGYKIYYSTSSSMSVNTVKDITTAGTTSTVLSPLAPGTYYFVMSAYNTAGVESLKSAPIISKTLGAGASVSQTVKVTFPNPPTNISVE